MTVKESAQARFFVLRTPLLPFSVATRWGEGLAAPGCPDEPGELTAALAADRCLLRGRLAEIVTGVEFRDAVFVASPSLEAGIDGWRKDPDSERGQRVERALVAYLMRAASRATPFGLFAGSSTGAVGAGTCLRLPGRAGYRRHTRLDVDYLWALCDAVGADRSLRRDLLYRPNSSLYQIGDRLLYVETRGRAGGRSHQLVAVRLTPYLAQTLARAGAGPGETLGRLAAGLVEGDITEAEAEEYVADLVASGVLVSEAAPQPTGPPPTRALAATLGRRPSTAALARRLDEVGERLAAIDAAGLGASPGEYRSAASPLSGAPAVPDESGLVRVDLTKPAADLSLGAPVVAEILRGARLLRAFAPHRADQALRQFRDRFAERYETREMPLAQVLDDEHGVGFGRAGDRAAAPLLAGLPLGPRRESTAVWTDREAFLFPRLCEALARGEQVIELSAAEAAAAGRTDGPPLPDAFEVLASVAAAGEAAVRGGDFAVLVHAVSGPPGARLTGRFCHADAELDRQVRAHIRAEEAVRPDRVFAEIVHLPEGRAGNIVSRPVLRAYEIPYLGRPGVPGDRQLPLADLFVSVRGDRVVLRSKRLGREVEPRLTTAHNPARGLAVYRFLCALAQQDVLPGATWDWGPLRDAPRLPRVTSGRVVLARAQWNLTAAELAAFSEPAGAGRFAAVRRLRRRRGLPRHVVLLDLDNELVADLDNVLSVDALAHQVRRRERVTLAELFPGPGELCADGPEGCFTHQVVVPFVADRSGEQARETRPPGPAAGPVTQAPAPAARRFPPGSEWLYLKLYSGPATAEEALRRAAGPLAEAVASGAADRWFFVRLGDPDWHLRLRVHGEPAALLADVLPGLRRALAPLTESGQVWRVAADTYEREVERYGGDVGIDLAERIFHADSEAALAVAGALGGDEGAAIRWRAALLGVDLLLSDLGLTPPEKRELARLARDGYRREFGCDGAFQRAVSQRWREQRGQLEALLDPGSGQPPGMAGAVAALRGRSYAAGGPGRRAGDLARSGQLGAGLPELAMSYAHMHVNRILRAAQRPQELVIYEMLDRLYTSRAAREAR